MNHATLSSITVSEFLDEMLIWSEHHGKKPLSEDILRRYHQAIKTMTLKQVQAGINDAILEGAFFKDILGVIAKRKGIDHNREQLEQDANKEFDLIYEAYLQEDSSEAGEKRAEAFAARAYCDALNQQEFHADLWTYTPLSEIKAKLLSQKNPKQKPIQLDSWDKLPPKTPKPKPVPPPASDSTPDPYEMDQMLNEVLGGIQRGWE